MSGAIMMSDAFLECVARQFFAVLPGVRGVPDEKVPVLRAIWDNDLAGRGRFGEDFILIYRIVRGRKLPRNESWFKNGEAVHQLRNRLVHRHPEFITFTTSGSRESESRLESAFKSVYARMGKTNPTPEDMELDAACAWWCVDAAEEFVRGFCKLADLTPTFLI